ncbi:MAG: hypothetical protein JWO77_424 [Ilumatobacteraceae bacterium]|nr:hypothetical protein [Ilumatobacteraceae bacterium]
MTDERRRASWWVGAAALTSVALRLPSLRTPLSVDEAGALTVARSWAAGQRLYVDTFIDRPQGVVAVFQRWDALTGGSPAAIRSLAVIAGVAVVVASALAVRAASGRWSAAVVAAWLVAVVTSSPAIEGYAANGELLAAAATIPAMAVGALVAVRRLPPPWLLAAGMLAAAGITVKQSAFDVLVALGAWILVAVWRRWRTPREAAALLGWLVAGSGAVVGLAVWHATTLGWDAYAYALYGFRLHARSAVAGPQASRMVLTSLVAFALLGPAVVLAVRRLRLVTRPLAARVQPGHALVLVWTAVAAAGFFAGGNYHRHYWIQIAIPVASAVAIGLTAGPRQEARQLVRTTAAALALPLVISVALIARPTWERDPRLDADAAIARWYQVHRASAGDDLLPLCASVTWYPDAGQLPRTPYLWVDHVRFARGALDQIIALVDGPGRPTYLAIHQPIARCDPSGRLGAAVRRHYRRVATIHGVDVLEATDGT